MKSTIAGIYLNQNPNSETVKPNKKYRKAASKLAVLCEEFEKELNEKQVEKFQEIYFLHGELEAATEEEYFKEGFKFGLKIAIETFN